MRKILHISHTDLDGYGCHILSKLIEQCAPFDTMQFTYENINPNQLTERVKTLVESELTQWDAVIITDLNINPTIIDLIVHCEDPEKIRVFDHHQTPITADDMWWHEDPLRAKYYELFSIQVVKPSKPTVQTCGTEIYFDFIRSTMNYEFIKSEIGSDHLNNIGYFVDCVRAWDTRAWASSRDLPTNERSMEDIDAPRLNRYFHTVDHDKFIQYILDYFRNQDAIQLTYSSDSYPEITPILEIMEDMDNRYVKRMVKRAAKCDLLVGDRRYKVAVTMADHCMSDIGAGIMQEVEGVDAAIVVNDNTASIYSNHEDVDCSEIARAYGGGGHKGAAGFSITYIQSKALTVGYLKKMLTFASQK